VKTKFKIIGHLAFRKRNRKKERLEISFFFFLLILLYLFSKALKVFLYLVSSEERNKKATSKAKFKNHIFNYSKKLQITAIIFTLLKKKMKQKISLSN